jgi:hypothetical protein
MDTFRILTEREETGALFMISQWQISHNARPKKGLNPAYNKTKEANQYEAGVIRNYLVS